MGWWWVKGEDAFDGQLFSEWSNNGGMRKEGGEASSRMRYGAPHEGDTRSMHRSTIVYACAGSRLSSPPDA